MIQPQFEPTFEGWRDCARDLIQAGTPPGQIHWDKSALSLFQNLGESEFPALKNVIVPGEFLKLAEAVAYARDEERWALLYRLLFRIQTENRDLLKIAVDPDVHRAMLLFKSVRRDIHKMHAFVRFKHAQIEGEDVYVAWHKPEHFALRPGVPFFVRRFGDKRWSIFTPDESAHWDLQQLKFGEGMQQRDFEYRDNWDEVWKTYYRSIFNPARIKIKAMKLEMAPKYWSALPEAGIIQELIREAPERLQTMARTKQKAAEVPKGLSLNELREKAAGCTACPLYKLGTQTVFGKGPASARIVIVGEQPGDQEDKQGEPFVGPAGAILDRALEQAGLERSQIYFTNAVKHFKWAPRGKMRLHQKPNGSEMHACMPWLEAEIAAIRPQIIVALGATAGTAVLGRLPKVTEERGQVFRDIKAAPYVLLSWHPSAILRAFDDQQKNERTLQLAHDLKKAKELLQGDAYVENQL